MCIRDSYVDHGADPVSETGRKLNQEQKKPRKLGIAVPVVAFLILVFASGGWLVHRHMTKETAQKEAVSLKSVNKSSLKKTAKSSERLAKKQSEEKAKAESESKAKAESESKAKAESESKAKAESESKAKAESESRTEEETQTVTVGDGETIGELADKYATTVQRIQELNNMGDSIDLVAGATIKVPK